MPADTLNIRYEVESEQFVVLTQKLDKDGYLSSGYIHFPPGCMALVLVRVSVERGGSMIHVCPVEDKDTNTAQYVALDNFTFPFPIDLKVKKNDMIQVELRNTDDTQDHRLSVLVYRWDNKPALLNELSTLLAELRGLIV